MSQSENITTSLFGAHDIFISAMLRANDQLGLGVWAVIGCHAKALGIKLRPLVHYKRPSIFELTFVPNPSLSLRKFASTRDVDPLLAC